MLVFPVVPGNHSASMMAASGALMAIWWVTEALPLAATALLPLALFPILGIDSGKNTASVYLNSTIFIYLGGFLIAIAMQRWNLHKRIALFIINKIGSGAGGIVLGFMIAAASLSMFVSNVATTVMMLPIGLAVIYKMEENAGSGNTRNFSVAVMLGIAYAASIGGIATLIGTAPNLIYKKVFEMYFPEGPQINFSTWLLAGFPVSAVMLTIAWAVLVKFVFRIPKSVLIDKSALRDEYKALGKMSREEKIVLAILALTGLLWMTRSPVEIESFVIPGWSGIFGRYAKYVDDGTVAIFTSLWLFILPAKNKAPLLNNKAFSELPWDVILIFGGGFALAGGFQNSGLSEWLGGQFAGLKGLHPFFMTLGVSSGLTFLTEITSNTATTNTILPILASVAKSIEVNPILIMLPAAISASFAFMLPVATPPNAIVYGSGRVRVADMVKAGIFLNISGILIVTGLFYLVAGIMFGADLWQFPAWAR